MIRLTHQVMKKIYIAHELLNLASCNHVDCLWFFFFPNHCCVGILSAYYILHLQKDLLVVFELDCLYYDKILLFIIDILASLLGLDCYWHYPILMLIAWKV